MSIRKPEPHELPSMGQLRRSALGAVLVALLLAVTVVLPAERGIDPTGIGERLQLTRIGLLKTAMAAPDAPQQGRPEQQDRRLVTIAPGQAREIKMHMRKGFVARYDWQASQAVLHDTHGDLPHDESVYITYSRADAVTADNGTIEAAFAGNHGWYWENNGSQAIVITLDTRGEYLDIVEK